MKLHHVVCLIAGSLCTLIFTTAWQTPSKASQATPTPVATPAITVTELGQHPSQYDGKCITVTGYLEEQPDGTEELLRVKSHALHEMPYTLHPYKGLHRAYRMRTDKPAFTLLHCVVAQKDGSLTFHQDTQAAFSWQKRFGGRILVVPGIDHETGPQEAAGLRIIGPPTNAPFLGYVGLQTIKGTWHWLADKPDQSYLELDT